jgi:hypothetical protein
VLETVRSNIVESALRSGLPDGVTFTFTVFIFADTLVIVEQRVWGNGCAVTVTQVFPAASESKSIAPSLPTSSDNAAVW